MLRSLAFAATLVLSLLATLAHAATGTLAWGVTTSSTPPLVLDHVNLNSADVGPRSSMDAAGNLYVAASSISSSPSNACAVYLKYSAADGTIVWRHQICTADLDTFSGSLALDASGDVLVTGAVSGQLYVAKLSAADGTPVWEQQIAGASAVNAGYSIGVDAAGDARVAGLEGSSSGDITIYGFAGGDGTLQFVRGLTNTLGSARLNSFAVDPDGGSAIAEVDSDGNNTVAARISRIDNFGSVTWQTAASAEHLTLDPSGNVIASDGAGVRKYDAATGSLDWTQAAVNGPTVADANGDIYATGAANRDLNTGDMDVGTWKLAPDGSILWSNVIVDSTTHAAGTAIALDGAGAAFVAADARESDGTHSAQVVKYSAADGSIAWTATDHDANVANFAYSIHANTQGAIELGSAFQQLSSTAIGLRALKYVDPAATPQDPTISISSSPNPSNAGSSVTFTATVGGSLGPATGTLTFQSDGANIASCTNLIPSSGTYQCSDSSLSSGTHSITARFSGDANYNAATSSAFTQTVNPPGTKVDATVTLDSTPNPSAPSSEVQFTARVSGTLGQPTGTVTFTDGSTVLCDAVPLNGFADCFAPLGAGTHVVAASYSGDATYNPGTASVTQVVQSSSPAGLSFSPTSLDFGGESMGTTSPPQAVTVTNTSGGSITISNIGTSDAQFSQSNDCTTLASGATCTITVTFTPAPANGALDSSTAVSGSLTVDSDDPGSPYNVSLAGSAEKSLVTHFYEAILRRAPDAGGKSFWEGEAERMSSLGADVNETWYAMASQFFSSAEYKSLARDDTGFVTDLYETFFNRPPDASGLSFWVGQLDSGTPREVVLVSFELSPEFTSFSQAIFGNNTARAEVNVVMDFYRGLLARLPDSAGFDFWVGQFRTAQCQDAAAVYDQVQSISSQFADGTEYANRNRTNAQYVGDLYNAFLRRGGDQQGVQFWIQQLDSGAQTRDQVRQQFIASPEFTDRANAIVNQGCMQ